VTPNLGRQGPRLQTPPPDLTYPTSCNGPLLNCAINWRAHVAANSWTMSGPNGGCSGSLASKHEGIARKSSSASRERRRALGSPKPPRLGAFRRPRESCAHRHSICQLASQQPDRRVSKARVRTRSNRRRVRSGSSTGISRRNREKGRGARRGTARSAIERGTRPGRTRRTMISPCRRDQAQPFVSNIIRAETLIRIG